MKSSQAGRETAWARVWHTVRAYGLTLAVVNFMAGSPALASDPIRILAFGDSLTAGYNLPSADSFPVRLEKALRAQGYAVSVQNAGVSGDTSAGGRARLDWALAGKPQVAIVELGANDGLRGLDPGQMRENLDVILTRLGDRGVKVLLTGMLAPSNYGRDYAERFRRIFPELAEKHKAALYPFFLDGVATRPDLNQPDGLHPNAKGVEVIVEHILPHVKQLLDNVTTG
ncbi:MAG: arylesterase [Rhodospirillales bacterium]|nr:arylesterase [Rhodospirillales bacterium]